MSAIDSLSSLNKPIVETAYLTAQNVHRYRMILRHFYRQHQQLNYWLTVEEIQDFLATQPAFADYNREQCEQDLNALVQWKNLLATQDAGKVQTIEEFKNRRFRYQLTPYTVEIERLIIKLESISGVGGSLEANLLERIAQQIHFLKTKGQNRTAMHSWWQDLSLDFQRLNDNATDYIASLQRGKLEELLNTQAFLTYKDGIIEYLRNFIKELQRFGPAIESELKQLEETTVQAALSLVMDHERSIPRLEEQVDPLELEQEIRGRWRSLNTWFCGSAGRASEAARLLGITNGIIRRLTRFAYRLAESRNSLVSRHRECLHLAELFAGCADLKEAHLLSAAVLGATHTRHLSGDFSRVTDSALETILEEPAFVVPLKPRTRGFRERLESESIRSRVREKQKTMNEYLKIQRAEQQVLSQYIQDSIIDFENLPILEPHVRITLLRWIGKAMGNAHRTGYTEEGRAYQVKINPARRIVLRCQDGELEMPAVRLFFLESEGS